MIVSYIACEIHGRLPIELIELINLIKLKLCSHKVKEPERILRIV